MEEKKLWLFDLAHGNLSEDAIVRGFIKFYILQGQAIGSVQDDIHFHTRYGDDNCRRAMEDLRSALESSLRLEAAGGKESIWEEKSG